MKSGMVLPKVKKQYAKCTPAILSLSHRYFPRIVRTRSINFTVCIMRGQFEGALYSRARFNSPDHAAKPRHIVKLDRTILMQEVL